MVTENSNVPSIQHQPRSQTRISRDQREPRQFSPLVKPPGSQFSKESQYSNSRGPSYDGKESLLTNFSNSEAFQKNSNKFSIKSRIQSFSPRRDEIVQNE